ncbi:MAG: hypothetical protein ACK5AZ_24850 [Bryobacteraceae bacterium]
MPALSLAPKRGEVRTVRLPRTAERRSELTYCQLLQRVRRSREGFGYWFEGKHFRSGVTIDERELWPDATWPATPIVLECAGGRKGLLYQPPNWGHRRAAQVYVLWRYERERGEFVEVARVVDRGQDWIQDMAPIAIRELNPRPVLVDPAASAKRVLEALEAELDPLQDPAARKRVLLAVYDQFVSAMVEAA